MNNTEKKYVAISTLFFIVTLLISINYLLFYNNSNYKVINGCKIIKSKHESVNKKRIFGSSSNEYYFLYLDGSISKVKLETFIHHNSGDEFCIN